MVQAGRGGGVVGPGGGHVPPSWKASTSLSVASARIHDEWLSSVCELEKESRFHTLMDLSLAPEKRSGPERASARTRLLCPLSVCLAVERRELLKLWGGRRRAAQATAGFRGAQAALRGAEEQPKPEDPPGARMGRGRQTGQTAISSQLVCRQRIVLRSHTLISLSCEAETSCRSVTTRA